MKAANTLTTLPVRIIVIGPRVLGLVLLTGCVAVGPEEKPPVVAVPASFVGAQGPSLTLAKDDPWWQGFSDRMLNGLVARGLAANMDIAQAKARITAAEAGLRGTGLASQVDGSQSQRITRTGGDSAPTDTATSQGITGRYVFDLFGGVRRGQEQAMANRDAAVLDAATTRLAVIASIVGRYIDARYHQQALALTQETISGQEQTLDLVNAQFRAGLATEIDVIRAQSELDTARAEVPALRQDFETSVFALATLLAEPAEPVLRQLEVGGTQPRPQGGLATGIPADLLRNRPDLRAAESRVAAALAAVGVAKADLLPSLTLSGSVTEADGTGWSFGPELTLPIFNRGHLAAKRDEAAASAKVAELAWRAMVLDATQDVQTAASAYLANQSRMTRLADAVTSNARLVEISRETYARGDTTLIDLLNAEQSYNSARLSLAAAVRQTALSWTDLQIAVGRDGSAPL